MTLKVTQYDIVFVAVPGETYSLVVEPGADRPRYDEAILGYIDRVQDPVRFEIRGKTGSGDPCGIIGGEDGPTGRCGQDTGGEKRTGYGGERGLRGMGEFFMMVA